MTFSQDNGCVLVTITGQGSKDDVPKLAAHAKAMMAAGIRHFTVELGECTGLDPEVIGTLAGIALRLDELGSGSIRLLNLNADMKAGLRDLQLDRLFEFQ